MTSEITRRHSRKMKLDFGGTGKCLSSWRGKQVITIITTVATILVAEMIVVEINFG
jgi:hypothetical protein